jgi:hypothetical protein
MFLGFVRDYSNDEMLASFKTHWVSEHLHDLGLSDKDLHTCMKMVFEFEKNSQLTEIQIHHRYEIEFEGKPFQVINLDCGKRFGFVWIKNKRVGHRTQQHQLF